MGSETESHGEHAGNHCCPPGGSARSPKQASTCEKGRQREQKRVCPPRDVEGVRPNVHDTPDHADGCVKKWTVDRRVVRPRQSIRKDALTNSEPMGEVDFASLAKRVRTIDDQCLHRAGDSLDDASGQCQQGRCHKQLR